MKILVLNGSPRAQGNTAALVSAFAEGAQAAGHSVNVLTIGTKNIAGCRACEYCHTKGNETCVQKDDMLEVYAALNDADMLVLATPIYYFSMTGQIQCAIQRIYAYPSSVPPKVKKTALIMSAQGGGYTSPTQAYKEIAGYMGARDMGILKATGRQNKSKEKLDEAYQLGNSLT